jgi:hypothetical protein
VQMVYSWAMLVLPMNNGLPVTSSTAMQPTAHMSTGLRHPATTMQAQRQGAPWGLHLNPQIQKTLRGRRDCPATWPQFPHDPPTHTHTQPPPRSQPIALIESRYRPVVALDANNDLRRAAGQKGTIRLIDGMSQYRTTQLVRVCLGDPPQPQPQPQPMHQPSSPAFHLNLHLRHAHACSQHPTPCTRGPRNYRCSRADAHHSPVPAGAHIVRVGRAGSRLPCLTQVTYLHHVPSAEQAATQASNIQVMSRVEGVYGRTWTTPPGTLTFQA